MRLICLVVAALLAAASPIAAGPVTARTETFVHPVLIGKTQNELVQITIEADSLDMTWKGVTVSLAGTSDLGDIESVSLLGEGRKKGFNHAEVIAGPRPPSARLTFAVDQPLAKGKTHLWLACTLKSTASLDHRVQATITEIDTSVGTVVVEQHSKGRGHRIGVALRQAGDDGVHTYRIPALATTKDGTLLCVFDIRRKSSRDLQGDIDVGLVRSTDGGATWSPTQVIMDIGTYGGLPEDQNGVGDPGIIVDHETGEIFCFALWVHAKPGTHQWRGDGSEPGFDIGKTAQFLLVRSTDDGKTWSVPENLTRLLKKEGWALYAPSPQQGIQLADGTLVMPAQGRDEDGPFANLIISRDHGRTWSVSQRAHSGGNECQAVQLSDGSIMLNIRNGGKKRRAVAITSDLGQTWQYHSTHEKDLIEPTCNGSLYRWTQADGPALLLFANPQSLVARTHHTIQVSTDDGVTWPKESRLLLDEGRGAGYPTLSRVDDGHIGIVYEGSQAHLVFERIAYNELVPASP